MQIIYSFKSTHSLTLMCSQVCVPCPRAARALCPGSVCRLRALLRGLEPSAGLALLLSSAGLFMGQQCVSSVFIQLPVSWSGGSGCSAGWGPRWAKGARAGLPGARWAQAGAEGRSAGGGGRAWDTTRVTPKPSSSSSPGVRAAKKEFC